MKKVLLAAVIAMLMTGCSMAEKTAELGSGMSNVGHPLVMLPGMALNYIGNSLK